MIFWKYWSNSWEVCRIPTACIFVSFFRYNEALPCHSCQEIAAEVQMGHYLFGHLILSSIVSNRPWGRRLIPLIFLSNQDLSRLLSVSTDNLMLHFGFIIAQHKQGFTWCNHYLQGMKSWNYWHTSKIYS